MTGLEELERWMSADSEDEHLEFKEAKEKFDFTDLCRYCVALANERGGVLVLGVTDKRPRRVVGTRAYPSLAKVADDLFRKLRFRVDVDEVQHPDGRVLAFRVPARPVGTPLELDGTYLMRSGESLVPMTPDVLHRIFDEATPDYTAEVCPEVTMESLSPEAIERFRTAWIRKSGNQRLAEHSPAQLLADAELLVDGWVTYAALILLGTRDALARHVADAEVVFEYRSTDTSIEYQSRANYREGFLLFQDSLWEAVNSRNELEHYQDGLFKWSIPAFSEKPVREAILNAVAHRDYRVQDSVFIRHSPRRLDVTSPGGFPEGVTESNILTQRVWRNRRLAEALERCTLVERSGQGVDLMYETCLREGKALPSYAGTNQRQVSLCLSGAVDPTFVRYLESVDREQQTGFTLEDMLVLDLVRRDRPVPPPLLDSRHHLIEAGAIERVGAGRGARYLLARRYYQSVGTPGVYTRKAGLDRETNKQLLLKHIRESRDEGSRFADLSEVLPQLSRSRIQVLLRELAAAGEVHVRGRTRSALWFPGPE